MSKAEKKDALKIKEFEWYEVESKVREIMGDLLQPFNKKQTEETIKLNQLRRSITNLTKKVEDHDFLLEREQAEKPTYIQEQDDRINHAVTSMSEHQVAIESSIRNMQVTIEVYQQKVTQLNDLERRLDSQILQRANDFKNYKQHLDEQTALMLKKQETQQEDINNFRTTTRTMVNKLETKVVGFENRLRELEDDSKRKGVDIAQLNDLTRNMSERLVRMEQKFTGLSEKVEDREKDSKLSEKFLSKVKEVENDLKFIQNFLQSYQPLYIQMQISDTLASMVEGRQRRKLCLYEQKRFAKLHEHILQDERTTIQEMMTNFSNNIRKIINRNKKYVINLTVQESVKYGTNLYEFRAENYEDNDQDLKKPMNIIVPEADILKVVQQRWDKLMPEIKTLLLQQVQPTRQWMKELQEQSLLRALDFDRKFDQVNKHVLQHETNLQLTQTSTDMQLKDIVSKQQAAQLSIAHSNQCLKDVLNFSSVINHIVIQDEIDRQGTALYALQSKGADSSPVPTFQLDPTCMNCSAKSSGAILQAFKMACLAYNPSQIRIDQQLFSREQILQISTNILEKVKRKIDSDPKGKINQITSEKGAIFSITHRGKSHSTAKELSSSRRADRSKDLQTLLPVVPSRRTAQLSQFY